MKAISVLCVLPLTHAARIAKRIDMYLEAGFQVEAVAFERDYGGGRLPACDVESLGTLLHGQLLRRVPRLLRSVGKVRAAIRRHDVVHAFNPDMALLALVAGVGLGRPVVVEVADVREAQTADGLAGRVVRGLDRFTARNCPLLIVTSNHYLSYYRDWLGVKTPELVLENKLSGSFCNEVQAVDSPEMPGCVLRDRPMRLGWFGRLRDGWSLRVIDAISRSPQNEITVTAAGSLSPPVKDLPRLATSNPRIEYLGPYHHPKDLPALFGSVDVVLACRSPEVPSCWSRTNRYYDACLFGKPLIVRAGCADADETARHNIGLVINEESPEVAASAICRITAEDLDRWRTNIRALPRSVYANDGDAEALSAAIANVVK